VQFLTSEQCGLWAAQHGFPFSGPPDRESLEAEGYRSTEFEIPTDAGRRVALARLLWEAGARNRPESLLWIMEWSVWPSGEHLPLALALRSAFGGNRTLREAPGHLFRSDEDDAGLSFLVVSLLFLWDACLLSASGDLAVVLSHDEYGSAFARTPDVWLPLEKRLAAFRGPAE
jgi:hypothetical protein